MEGSTPSTPRGPETDTGRATDASHRTTTEPAARASSERAGPLLAILQAAGQLFFVWLAGLILLVVSLPVAWLAEQGLDRLQGHVQPEHFDVWKLEETAPGAGDPAGVTAAVERAGFPARWIFEDDGTGRVALDCEGPCFEHPQDEFRVFAPLVEEHGFTVSKERPSPRDYRGGLANYWADDLLFEAWMATAAIFLPLLLFGIGFRRHEPEARLPSARRAPLSAAVLGVALGAGLALAELAALWTLPWLDPHTAPLSPLGDLASAGLLGFVLALLLGAVLAPLAEEYYFRGWMLPFLDRQAGTATAYLGSAGIWALLRLDLSALPILVPVGIVLAWSYRRWGTLLVPITAHAVANAGCLIAAKLTAPPF